MRLLHCICQLLAQLDQSAHSPKRPLSMATADKISVRLLGCLVAHGRFCVNFAGE